MSNSGWNLLANMTLLLLAAAFMFVASAMPSTEWEQYKAKYKKVYTSRQEDSLRYNEYLKTKKLVEEHNKRFEKGESSYSMGINHFSDWFPEEINRMLGTKMGIYRSRGEPFELPAGTPVPDSINWVEKGAVTTVKNQGDCGSCYAFSAVGSLEALMFRTNNTITDLSPQELVDCSVDNYGCGGGTTNDCFDYVMFRNGIDTDASYPYKAVKRECRADEGVIGATCIGYKAFEGEDHLTEAVGTVGPISISFGASYNFTKYKSGIYDGDCEVYLNHAMLAVGYDKDNITGQEYWLIKNSWGESWGEKGYVRIIRNVNKCKVSNDLSYPFYDDAK